MLTSPTKTDLLVDEIRDLQAKLAGKQIELCLAIGDREGAQFYRREMYAVCEARRASAVAQNELTGSSCYFHDQAERDLPAILQRQAA